MWAPSTTEMLPSSLKIDPADPLDYAYKITEICDKNWAVQKKDETGTFIVGHLGTYGTFEPCDLKHEGSVVKMF